MPDESEALSQIHPQIENYIYSLFKRSGTRAYNVKSRVKLGYFRHMCIKNK